MGEIDKRIGIKMKKILPILIILILASFVYAQEEAPKYNFGSMQAAKELNIAPGEIVETKLYFYNAYGNRITHIALSVGEAPENWGITLEPALHETRVSVSGIETIVTENLYVEPSEAVKKIPATVPEGIEYISSKIGYIGAKPVIVKITVPKDEKLGKVAKVVIEGAASWLGQAGTVALKQGRSFEYTVTVTSKEFIEEIVPILEKAKIKETFEEEEKEEVELVKAEIKEPSKEPTGAAVKEPTINIPSNMTTGVIIVLLLVIIVLLVILVKKKK